MKKGLGTTALIDETSCVRPSSSGTFTNFHFNNSLLHVQLRRFVFTDFWAVLTTNLSVHYLPLIPL